MKFGVITFPGSNCDQDIIHVLRNVMGCEVIEVALDTVSVAPDEVRGPPGQVPLTITLYRLPSIPLVTPTTVQLLKLAPPISFQFAPLSVLICH